MLGLCVHLSDSKIEYPIKEILLTVIANYRNNAFKKSWKELYTSESEIEPRFPFEPSVPILQGSVNPN